VRTERLAREFGLILRHTVFPLHPEVPPEGMALAELFSGRDFDLEAAQRRLRQVAAEVGLPLGERSHTCNSRRAQELGKWAEESGRGEAFRAAAYAAFFVDGRNLYQIEVLTDLARLAGLDPEEAAAVISEQRYAAAVDSDWQRGRELGIHAVPTLLYRDRSLVGFAPYADLRRLIES